LPRFKCLLSLPLRIGSISQSDGKSHSLFRSSPIGWLFFQAVTTSAGPSRDAKRQIDEWHEAEQRLGAPATDRRTADILNLEKACIESNRINPSTCSYSAHIVYGRSRADFITVGKYAIMQRMVLRQIKHVVSLSGGHLSTKCALEEVCMINHQLKDLLDRIGDVYKPMIMKGSRNYLEVSIGKQATEMGYADLKEKYQHAWVIVPLKSPQNGMKVRIDGRTFVNYSELTSGIAVPGHLAKAAGQSFKRFVPNDSMICNFA
jgi:hypothetical protein